MTTKKHQLSRMLFPSARIGLPLLLMLWVLTGCGAVEKDKLTISLQSATNSYQSALRWGYYETAYGFVHPDQRENKAMPDFLENLRLTGYDVTQPLVMKDDHSATQIVAIEYLFEDRQVVKKLTDRQVWRWDETRKSWWLHSGLPKFDAS